MTLAGLKSGDYLRCLPGTGPAFRRMPYLLLAACCLRRAAKLRENLFLAEDQQLFVVNLNFRAAVLAEQNPVAWLDVEGDALSLFTLASADGDYFAFLLLFLG